jgi:hypothetical protein
MPVNSVDMFASLFMLLLPVLVMHSNFYIVISGPRLLLASPVTNITLSFLTIIRIIYGRFRYVSSLTLSLPCGIFLPTFTLSLVSLFRASRATMAANSTILLLAPSLRLTGFYFACRAPIPPLKMVKLNALSAPLTMLFAPYYFT